jgi:hypothetical protein
MWSGIMTDEEMLAKIKKWEEYMKKLKGEIKE